MIDTSELILLSQAGVSVDIESLSALQPTVEPPDGKLIAVYPDGKGEVQIYLKDGSKGFLYKPADWFREKAEAVS